MTRDIGLRLSVSEPFASGGASASGYTRSVRLGHVYHLLVKSLRPHLGRDGDSFTGP